VLWGALGLIVSAVWLFVWPSDQAVGVSALQYFVLRWFHAIVWLLLSAAAFAAAAPGRARVAQVLGWLALLAYAVFLAVMLTSG